MSVNEGHKITQILGDLIRRLPFQRSIIRRLTPSWLKKHFDDRRLERLSTPLPGVAEPGELAWQLNACSGDQSLFNDATQTAINAAMGGLQANEVFNELSKSVTATLEAHRMGKLNVNLRVVTRGLATISMSSLVPNGGHLSRELSDILAANRDDKAGLLSRYRTALLSGHAVIVGAVDQRIAHDEIWGKWSDTFMREGLEMACPSRPNLIWEFTESAAAEKDVKDILGWLFRKGPR